MKRICEKHTDFTGRGWQNYAECMVKAWKEYRIWYYYLTTTLPIFVTQRIAS